MANLIQLKMLEDLDGVLLVDKPEGIAFSTVVKTVKRKFNLVKVGHGGSLESMASGLLVLLINGANRFVGEIMGADRSYSGTIEFGTRTDTGDIFGNPLEPLGGKPPDAESLAKALKEFKGDVFQTEPRFCAVRKEGSAEYEIADTGEHSQFLAHVYRFALDGTAFEIVASKSLIVRALVNDFGEALGCGACLKSLRRTKVGRYDVSGAIGFEKLLETGIGDFASCVIPLSKALR
jgi:tRNA pseudouridine55 synthase